MCILHVHVHVVALCILVTFYFSQQKSETSSFVFQQEIPQLYNTLWYLLIPLGPSSICIGRLWVGGLHPCDLACDSSNCLREGPSLPGQTSNYNRWYTCISRRQMMLNNSYGTCVCTCTLANTRLHSWILEVSVRFPKHFGIDLPVLLRLHHYNVNFWLCSPRYTSAHLACFLRRHGNRIFIVRRLCIERNETLGNWGVGLVCARTRARVHFKAGIRNWDWTHF